MITTQGYERIGGSNSAPDAVRWWYVRHDDGEAVFARGGLVRKCRHARHAIEEARNEAARELEQRKLKPTHRLTRDGDVVPL